MIYLNRSLTGSREGTYFDTPILLAQPSFFTPLISLHVSLISPPQAGLWIRYKSTYSNPSHSRESLIQSSNLRILLLPKYRIEGVKLISIRLLLVFHSCRLFVSSHYPNSRVHSIGICHVKEMETYSGRYQYGQTRIQ
jgi:hypothetical protein